MSRFRSPALLLAFVLVAAFLGVVDVLDLVGGDAGVRVVALVVVANVALVAWPLAMRVAPLISIWAIAAASLAGAPISNGRNAAGALFWLILVAAAWGMRSETRTRAIAHWAAFVVAGAVILGETPDTTFTAEIFWIGALGGAVYLAARFIARYRQQAVTLRAQALLLEHEREEHARLAAAEERARIARELHDVVAHSVSVMVMHAGAVRRLLRDDQVDERAALESLESTGRASMSEIRRALGVLRRPEDVAEREPQRGLTSLEQLVSQLRDAGLRVELVIDGQPESVGPGVDIAAYRIAQEALTNVVKHAAGARVDVRVRYGADAVEVEVLDDGGGGSTSTQPPGYGLVGLRERATVLGGTLHADARPGGGFRVHATLPLEAST